VTPKGEGRDPDIFGAIYLENAWRLKLASNEEPIENPISGIETSRDRWRHVILKGQGRDPNMFRDNISKTAGDSESVTMERI